MDALGAQSRCAISQVRSTGGFQPALRSRLEVCATTDHHAHLPPRKLPRPPFTLFPSLFTIHLPPSHPSLSFLTFHPSPLTICRLPHSSAKAFTTAHVTSPSTYRPTRSPENPTFRAREPTRGSSRPAPVTLYTALFQPAKGSPNKPHL